MRVWTVEMRNGVVEGSEGRGRVKVGTLRFALFASFCPRIIESSTFVPVRIISYFAFLFLDVFAACRARDGTI